ncbi:endolytic transglycosylase MltG [Thalassotalea sp. SU-HH00458]|uniref:endolytic transglycosylase MltG n=1 Tax=Thalassotalea sp. SU-HH00458 TaxID=3127657 RepID=UPI0031054A19
MTRLTKITIAGFFIVCMFFIALVAVTYLKINDTNLLVKETFITIEPGTTFNRFTKKLQNNGVVATRFWLRNYIRLNNQYAQIKAGTYLIKPGQSYRSILSMIAQGDEHQYFITFVEGSTFKQWLAQLKERSEITQRLQSPESISQMLESFGIKQANPEGLFFPDTYAFTYKTTDIEVLKKAYLKMKQQLDIAWNTRAIGLPYENAYQALIMASIIEKESGQFSEHRRISSVFINRLNENMRLQTDPTVIYGLGERYQGDIKRKHLREKTPYNTYRINGLPPTPIAMPGLSALEAAMHPEETDYFYFVSNGQGKHIFSTTLAEHNKAVAKYQLGK